MSNSLRLPLPRTIRIGCLAVAPATLCAAGIIVCAVALRLLLNALGWPPTDGDEGTMGILARHIADSGAHPIYFYGQAYMGTLEGYLGAAFFHLFGASVFTLRLGALLLYALFLVCMYLLARLLYNTPIALFTLLLLSLGTQEMLFRQLEAAGGYAETLLFGAAALLLAAWLALRPPVTSERPNARELWSRWLAFFGWGLAAGLGLWSDVLVLPFLVTSGMLLVMFRWRDLRSRAGLLLLAGLLLGALPVILHDLTSPLDQSIIAVTWQLGHQGGGSSLSLLAGGILGTLAVSLPNIFGATATCPIRIADAWPISGRALGCEAIRTGWGLGYLVLLALAASLALVALVPLVRRWRVTRLDAAERQVAALHTARLALVVSGALVLAAYVLNPIAARAPWPSSRYLMGLFLTFPAVLWPIWSLHGLFAPGSQLYHQCLAGQDRRSKQHPYMKRGERGGRTRCAPTEGIQMGRGMEPFGGFARRSRSGGRCWPSSCWCWLAAWSPPSASPRPHTRHPIHSSL